MDQLNAELYVELHCIIHQQLLCGKYLKFEQVMKVVLSAVKLIRSLDHRQFQFLLSKTDSEREDPCATQKFDG